MENNPFPNMPNSTDLGDGLQMIETKDRGHCFRVLEPDGKVSVVIAVNSPPPKPPIPTDKPFYVRQADSGQEVMSFNGEIVARTTDEAMAEHICKLLNVYEIIQKRKAASGA